MCSCSSLYSLNITLSRPVDYICRSDEWKVTRKTNTRTHVSNMLICISGNISFDICSFYQISHLWEGLALCVFWGQQRSSLQESLKTAQRKFPSGYFNSVYSCLRFLFPVLLSTLPALPFLLFLHHYCPLLAKKRHCALWRQHPVCQQAPKNFLTGVKHT